MKAWQLNERHYGALTGLNKDEMKKLIEKSVLPMGSATSFKNQVDESTIPKGWFND